jgi:hypothetical protein
MGTLVTLINLCSGPFDFVPTSPVEVVHGPLP